MTFQSREAVILTFYWVYVSSSADTFVYNWVSIRLLKSLTPLHLCETYEKIMP